MLPCILFKHTLPFSLPLFAFGSSDFPPTSILFPPNSPPFCSLLLIYITPSSNIMPRPISLRSVSSLSESNDGSSILYNGIEEAYLSATTNTSIASRSQRHFVCMRSSILPAMSPLIHSDHLLLDKPF